MSDTTKKPIAKRGGPSNAVLVVAILVALVGMGLVNTLIQDLDPKAVEQREQAKAEAEAKKQQEAQAAAQASNAATAGTTAGELATFGEEKILGKPDGKPEITIAWQWTPAVQADPTKVSKAIDIAVKVLPDARIRVINIDAKPDMAPGLYANGVKRFEPQPDGSFPAVEELYARMSDMSRAVPR